MESVPSAWCSFHVGSVLHGDEDDAEVVFFEESCGMDAGGPGFFRLRLVLLERSNWAILSTMVPSCMEVVMGRSFRL